LEGGPPSFPRDFPCPAVLGSQRHCGQASSPTGLSPSSVGLPIPFGSQPHLQRTTGRSSHAGPTTPPPQRLPPCTVRVWASAPFAHHYLGPRGCFLFLGVLRCFTSPGSPHQPMDSAGDTPASPGVGCPIRRSAAHSLLTAPRGFSQSPTSFIGPWRQGIPRALNSARHSLTGAPSLPLRSSGPLLFAS
jgi:hypothetical protein